MKMFLAPCPNHLVLFVNINNLILELERIHLSGKTGSNFAIFPERQKLLFPYKDV